MASKIKKLIRTKIKSDEVIDTSLQTIDLGQLSNLFIKFCSKFLQDGDIDKAGALLKYIGFIKNIQNTSLTYEKSFIMKHLERHGLLRNDFFNVIKESPMSKEEAEELKEIFGDQIESIKELIE